MAHSLIILLSILMLSGCQSVFEGGKPREVVLIPGMQIKATNKNGTFSTEYVNERTRIFRWNGNEKEIKMRARSERFPSSSTIRAQGDLGLYHPATARSYPRLVVREAIVHFDSMENVYRFLHQGSAHNDWVYTPDGLMLGFFETPERNQVNITVYQILLNGKKPSSLENARPENIQMMGKGVQFFMFLDEVFRFAW